MIITGSIHQEELTIINIYVLNTGAPKYIKLLITNISNLIDKNVVIAGDFNTPLTTMDRSSRQRISKETRALNDTLVQMDLTNIFRTLHPKAAEYTFFLSAHGTFSKIDHILDHKTSLNKYKIIEIIQCTLSDQNAMKLKTNHRKKSEKSPKAWKLKNILLKNEWQLEKKLRNIWKQMKMRRQQQSKCFGMQQRQS